MTRGTTKSAADAVVRKSGQVSPSTKRPKPSANPIFSKAGQFGGVLNGKPGDPRK